MLFECTISGGHRAGRAGTRVISYPWREQRDPNDSRAVVKITDWASPTVVHDLCRDGSASEEVDASTVHDLVRRQTACTAFHSSAEWTLGGPVGEERDRYTSDIRFPASWNRPDEQVVALDPWRVASNNCRKHVSKSANGETRTGDCPSGYTGSGQYDTWTEKWKWVEYAAPVPHVADHELAGSRQRVPTGSVNHCTVIPPPRPRTTTSGGNGGSDREDHRFYVDPDTGETWNRQPDGYDRHNPWDTVDRPAENHRPSRVTDGNGNCMQGCN